MLGFGLVMFTTLVSLVVGQIQSRRSGFSHLDKTLEVPVEKVNREFFLQGFRERLATLGFQPAGNEDTFHQGGVDLAALGSASHAKTKKLLTIRMQDSGPGKLTAVITLRYLTLIVIDTGEAAYRDAVLNFVSGNADEIVPVPTDSLMAINSLVGGIIGCGIAVYMIVSKELSLCIAITSIGVTEFMVGLLALFSINRKPAEITGRWKAVIGIVLSLAAIGTSVYFIIATT